MAVKTLLLFMAILFTTETKDKSGMYRRPSCGDMTEAQACPLNYSPVCGSDGTTYANELTKADILIVKEGPC
ncbi:hypothetical protein JZ751_008591 [Albula glossodonta]|uniref:Kazal-like domain-containing protein n=1 Tax=Albula glossodonta TaxID=121402 RepID=A0A8T2P9V1_9TELE|nr:hypothetical protein JZ751_008591 [Albula glossodonta]